MKTLSVRFQRWFAAGTLTVLVAAAGMAHAIPVLQLDIDGASYDANDESIVTTDAVFNLYAIGTPGPQYSAATMRSLTHQLVVAVIPGGHSGPIDFGSFVLNGTTYTRSSMTYGRPAELSPHGVYNTWYMEVAVNFVSSMTMGAYNVQEYPGTAGSRIGGEGAYYNLFGFDISGLRSGYNLHFDLHNDRGPPARRFAPYSHDAYTDCCVRQVPEPAPLALLGIGLVGLAIARKHRTGSS